MLLLHAKGMVLIVQKFDGMRARKLHWHCLCYSSLSSHVLQRRCDMCISIVALILAAFTTVLYSGGEAHATLGTCEVMNIDI